MKRIAILGAAMLGSCGQPADRLSDEEALAAATTAEMPAPEENVEEVAPSPVSANTEVLYRAVGTEPGWALLVRSDGMLFQGRYGELQITEATPPEFHGSPGTYRSGRLMITIAAGPCSDGMSDKAYRDKVEVVAAGERARGCGGGEVEVNRINGTTWTVTAVNGEATGGGAPYSLAFANGVVTGMIGCNSFEGSFSSNGDHLAIEQLMATEMACPAPAGDFERDGFEVLGSNLRMERSGGQLRLVSEAGTIDLARRSGGNGR